jgi:hypothetical protein
MIIDMEYCSSVVDAEVIKLLGGNLETLHTRKQLVDHGTRCTITSWNHAPGYVRGQAIDEAKVFTDENRRYLVSITKDGVDAFRFDDPDDDHGTHLSINPIWRYLWLCKVIEDAPPRLFKAYGELCFEDQDGNQLFVDVAIEEATFDPATNEFTVVVGRFDAHPLLVPDAWRGDVANTLAQQESHG